MPASVPAVLAAWMQPFASSFTTASWRHVLVLVAGSMLAPGRRTVTAALRIMGLDQAPGFAVYHRVLRVCPGTSCGIAKPSQHEADRGKAEEGERLAVEVLPILGQSTAAVQPSYGAFDDPALRQDDEALGLIGPLDDLHTDAAADASQTLLELRPLIAAVGVKLE